MSGRNINTEQASGWQENVEEEYFRKIDREMKDAKKNANKGDARAKIEALKEKKHLNDLIDDIFQDTDSIM